MKILKESRDEKEKKKFFLKEKERNVKKDNGMKRTRKWRFK